MIDAATEASRLSRAKYTWIIQPGADGQIRGVRTVGEATENAQALPLEVKDLFDRIVTEQPAGPLNLPHYDPEAGDGAYLALGLNSSRHMVGVLVLYFEDSAHIHDSHTTRLLQSMLHQAGIACENALLFETSSNLLVDVVVALVLAIESRDPYTGGHVMRVTSYSLMLGEKIGLDAQELATIRLGGLLHDIGKVGVPDTILLKPTELTSEEFMMMRKHAALGDAIIRPIPQLAFTSPVVRHHHERHDGKGYPDGLAGSDTPVVARVTAVADSFDAMITTRPYRPGLSYEEALAEIERGRGTQFDPDLAQQFIDCRPEQLGAAVDKMQQWRRSSRREGVLEFVDLLTLDLPEALEPVGQSTDGALSPYNAQTIQQGG